MKIFKIFGIIALAWAVITATSCTQDVASGEEIETPENVVDINAYVSVDEGLDFDQLLDDIESGITTRAAAPIDYPVGMVDLMAFVDDHPTVAQELCITEESLAIIDKPREEITFYDALDYEELVPNEGLASLLNVKGEIGVGEKVYRITPEGTYYFPKDKHAEFDAQYEQIKNLPRTEIEEREYQLSNDFYFIDSFYEEPYEEVDFDDETFDFPELDNYEVPDDGPLTRSTYASGLGIPKKFLDKFPTFSNQPKTTVGKWLKKLFTGGKKTVKLSSKRRLKGKLYDHKYGFYNEIGVKAKMQRKGKWGAWHKTKADKLVIGWSAVVLELKKSIPANPHQSASAMIAGLNSVDKLPGLGKKANVLTVFGIDVTNKDLLRALKVGLKEVQSYVEGKVGNGSSYAVKKADAFIFVHNRKVVLVIPEDAVSNEKKEKLKKKFYSSVQIHLSLTFKGWKPDYAAWARSALPYNSKLSVTSLNSAEVTIGGKLGDVWGGMKITTEKK